MKRDTVGHPPPLKPRPRPPRQCPIHTECHPLRQSSRTVCRDAPWPASATRSICSVWGGRGGGRASSAGQPAWRGSPRPVTTPAPRPQSLHPKACPTPCSCAARRHCRVVDAVVAAGACLSASLVAPPALPLHPSPFITLYLPPPPLPSSLRHLPPRVVPPLLGPAGAVAVTSCPAAPPRSPPAVTASRAPQRLRPLPPPAQVKAPAAVGVLCPSTSFLPPGPQLWPLPFCRFWPHHHGDAPRRPSPLPDRQWPATAAACSSPPRRGDSGGRGRGFGGGGSGPGSGDHRPHPRRGVAVPV